MVNLKESEKEKQEKPCHERHEITIQHLLTSEDIFMTKKLYYQSMRSRYFSLSPDPDLLPKGSRSLQTFL